MFSVSFRDLVLAKFCQNSARVFRMQECDVEVLSTFARSLVDETNTLAVAFSQRISYTILNAECYVVNALVAFVQPFLNGTLRRCGLKELKFNFTALEKSGLHLLVFHFFYGITLQSKNVLEVGKCLFNALNCDS